jgi:hypothetical protein
MGGRLAVKRRSQSQTMEHGDGFKEHTFKERSFKEHPWAT